MNFGLYGDASNYIEFTHQLIYAAVALLIIVPTIFFDDMSIYSHLSVVGNVIKYLMKGFNRVFS